MRRRERGGPNIPKDEPKRGERIAAAARAVLGEEGGSGNRHPQYKRGTFYEDTINKLYEAVEKASSDPWEAALDAVEGKDAVPVLTIHKSKGLEYAAVFFLGLEDGAFWNFSRTPDEELNTFFVALSRAKRRVAFTFARERNVGRYSNQSRRKIDEVYSLLADAGVPVVEMGSGDE